jgi:hypothetical protein
MIKFQSTNPRIVKGQYLLSTANGDKLKIEKALQKISEMAASISLGRGFNQSVEEYIQSNPHLLEFKNWKDSIEIDNNYNLIKF